MVERVDIIITDRVDPRVGRSLRNISVQALAADASVEQLSGSLRTLNTTSLERLAQASAQVTVASARETSAQARLLNARTRSERQAGNSALAAQRLATEQERTAAATARAEAASTRARINLLQEENAALRVARAKERETTAKQTNSAATRQNTAAQRANTRAARQAAFQTQNLIFQLNDVVVGLASGQRPLTVLLQQGSQISTIYGPGRGVLGTLQKVAAETFRLLRPVIRVAGVVGVLTGAFALFANTVDRSTAESLRFTDVALGTFTAIQTRVSTVIGPTINRLTALVRIGASGLGQIARSAFNTVARISVATVRSIGEIWNTLPATINASFRRAVNFAIDSLENLINSTLSAIRRPFELIDQLRARLNLAPLFNFNRDRVSLNEFRLTVNEQTRDIAQIVSDNLRRVQDVDFFGNIVQSFLGSQFFRDVVAASIEAQRQRITAQLEPFTQSTIENTTALRLQNRVTRERIGIGNDYGRQLAFENARLQIQTEIIRDQGPVKAADILNNRTAAETIDRVSAALADQIAQQNRLAATLRVYQQVRQPLIQYNEQLAILRDLLNEGTISQEEYAAALNRTPLARAVQGLALDLPESQFRAQLDQVRLREQERLLIVEQALQARILSEEEANRRVLEINRQAIRELAEVEQARRSLILTTSSDIFNNLAQASRGFADEQSGIYRTLFAVSKSFAIADSIIKIQQGIANALSLPFPANLAAAATVAANAASIVATIQGQNFRDGGRVRGPGGPTDDRVPANLSNGEFVVTAAAARGNEQFLEDLNARRGDMRRMDAPAGGGTQRVGRSVRVNVAMTVNTPNADSFRRSRNQIVGDLALEINRAMNRNT